MATTTSKDKIEPMLLNTRQAAAHLGMSDPTLYDFQKDHEVWKPDVRKQARCLYHIQHLRILEGLLLGNYSADDALEMWKTQKKQIGTMFVDTVKRRN